MTSADTATTWWNTNMANAADTALPAPEVVEHPGPDSTTYEISYPAACPQGGAA